jgi:hypothetical protein
VVRKKKLLLPPLLKLLLLPPLLKLLLLPPLLKLLLLPPLLKLLLLPPLLLKKRSKNFSVVQKAGLSRLFVFQLQTLSNRGR